MILVTLGPFIAEIARGLVPRNNCLRLYISAGLNNELAADGSVQFFLWWIFARRPLLAR